MGERQRHRARAVRGDDTGANKATGFAGYFVGRVAVNGTLLPYAGAMQIDHPLDPANKTLSQSLVQSPDMMSIYNGNITTDANGDATVALPAYFEALNGDYRYQLTVVGQFAQAIVAEKIANNQFKIKTDKPSVEVSWQVTGVRHDPYANANRIAVEQEKSAQERGRYLYPEGFGQPTEMGVANVVGAPAMAPREAQTIIPPALANVPAPERPADDGRLQEVQP
ncbi:MAG: hypothetical protein IPK16_07025 [Anaerolineales bacterium]|nr:hypothetical protein [Anaerolineales bacterium]